MPVLATDTQSPYITEAWVEFGLSITAVLVRVFARWKLMGFKGFGGDDYFCILATSFLTLEVTIIYLVGKAPLHTVGYNVYFGADFLLGRDYGSNTGWTPLERSNFSEAEIRQMAIGSKLVIIGWFSYASMIWSLKASVLLYYERLTSVRICPRRSICLLNDIEHSAGIFDRKKIKLSAIVCCVSYVAVIFTIAFHCRPFYLNWQVDPDPGKECTTHYSAYPVVAALNIFTDIIIITIPIPIIIQLNIKLIKKIMIGALLCSGIFIIVSALLRCVLTLANIKKINVAAIWAARESFIAFVAVNAPIIYPLFRKSMWVTSSGLANADINHEDTTCSNTE